MLQAISSESNVFFSGSDQGSNVKRVCLEAIEHKVNSHINQVLDHPSKPGMKMLYSYHLLHKLNPEISFIMESEEAQLYDCAKHERHIRSEELARIVEQNRDKNRKRSGNG